MNSKNSCKSRSARVLWRRCGGFAINTYTLVLGLSVVVAIGVVPSISSVSDDEVEGCVPKQGRLMSANARLQMLDDQIAQISEGKGIEDC